VKSSAPKLFPTVALALHPDSRGWVAAIGDRAGYRKPLWLSLGKPSWRQQLWRFALDQGGARLSIASYRQPGSRAIGNVRAGQWVMLDADGSQLWRTANPAPSIVIASGTPGHAHALWQLDAPASASELGQLIAGQRDLLGGDPGFNAGATATVRLPLDPADLWRFRPERICRPLQLRQRHRPSAVPKVPPKATRDSTPADRAASVAMAISRALAAVGSGESRNSTGWELTGELQLRGLTEEEALAVGGERYAEIVNSASAIAAPYELAEWEEAVRRRYERPSPVADPKHVERVDHWEVGWNAQPWLSPSQRTIVSAVAGRARMSGELTVTVSRRQLGLDARLAGRETVERALKGIERREGLIGIALKRDRRKRNGAKGAHRFELVNPPPSPPEIATSIPAFPVAWSRNAPPPKAALQGALPLVPSSTVPPNHDAWSWTAIGHGARLVFDVLLALDRPASVSELARHPTLSNCRKTIRRQLSKLEAAELVVALEDGTREAVTDDLEALLDVAAEVTERPGPDGKPERLAERLHRRNVDDRRHYELATDPAERQRKESEQLRRVCQRRGRRTLATAAGSQRDHRRGQSAVPSSAS
jgi:hypothetical protein